MGLLDSLGYGNQGGYGGLLDMLMYNSPLLKPQEAPPGPQYDPMGTPFAAAPQTATSPFPDLPAANYAQFAPQGGSPAFSPFNGGAAATPFASPATFTAGPTIAPQGPAPQPAPPANQVNDINVGGYQMPRLGGVTDFTSQAPQSPPTDVSAQSRAVPPQAPQQLPPALAGQPGGFSGAFQGFAANAHTGPLGALIGSIGGAMGAEGPEKQNLRAQYQALVPVLGQQKAMLAVMNPEAGKILLAQALEKKQYGFTKLDNDTIVNQDPQTGKVSLAYGGGEKAGDLTGPDGKKITIPEGLDSAGRKTFINEIAKINADAAAGKKTGEQATAEIFANKMELSNKTLDTLANQGTSLAGKVASGLPMGNYIQSAEYQKYKQASSNFITALLRKESGAAIGKSEFDRYEKEYMPQPGDGPEVLAQKTEARRVAIEGMKKGAGPGYKSPTGGPSQGLPSGWSVQVR